MIRPATRGKWFFTDEELQVDHTWESANNFKFQYKLGLTGKVVMVASPDFDDVEGLATAVAEFTAWHVLEIRPRLKSFKGYDLVKFDLDI